MRLFHVTCTAAVFGIAVTVERERRGVDAPCSFDPDVKLVGHAMMDSMHAKYEQELLDRKKANQGTVTARGLPACVQLRKIC